jgi:TPR repeat protein
MTKRERLKTKALAGDVEAQSDLARNYWSRRPPDNRRAVYWCRLAAEQGHVCAQFNLGCALMMGEGVRRDRAAAVAWFRRAAEQGHTGAQYNLGRVYDDGEGVTPDPKEAARWYRMVAERGDVDAQFHLAYLLNGSSD